VQEPGERQIKAAIDFILKASKLDFTTELEEKKKLHCITCRPKSLYLLDQILVQELLLDSLKKQGNRSLLTDGAYQGNLLQTGQHRT